MILKNLLFNFILLVLLISCKQTQESVEVVRPVKVTEVEPFDYTSVTYSGIVTPDQSSNLAFRTTGQIIWLEVSTGQSVKAGDAIAKINPIDYQLNYDAKNASYITAQQQLQRAEKLLSKQAISQQEYETTLAGYENSKAAFESAKQMLTETTLRAPFDGFIQEKFVSNYQEIRAGESVVSLINPKKLQMEANLPDNALSIIMNNPKIYVEFDSYKGVKFEAILKEYVQASPDGSGVPIFIAINDPKFDLGKYNVAVGFSCSIQFVVKDNNNLGYTVIPFSALVNNPNGDSGSVFIYDSKNHTVNRKNVEYGDVLDNDKVIIKSGLSVGDQVVSAGATRMVDGNKVKLLAN